VQTRTPRFSERRSPRPAGANYVARRVVYDSVTMLRLRQAACAVGLGVALLLGVLAAPALSSAPSATCTPAQHAKNAKALASYRAVMGKQGAVYFRTHKNPKQRAAFVRAQQAHLAALTRAASCRVVTPTTTTPLPAVGTRQNPYPLGASIATSDKWSVKITAVNPDA